MALVIDNDACYVHLLNLVRVTEPHWATLFEPGRLVLEREGQAAPLQANVRLVGEGEPVGQGRDVVVPGDQVAVLAIEVAQIELMADARFVRPNVQPDMCVMLQRVQGDFRVGRQARREVIDVVVV